MKMKKWIALALLTLITHYASSQEPSKIERAKNIVIAVNQKDANLYVENFSKDVKVYMYNENQKFELRIDGLEALLNNRSDHFKRYPNVRNEIQHLAEIDNRVIMHDKVWLNPTVVEGSDIVEIFTFNDLGKISRVDVIQQKELFNQQD
ncbi:nuclear transport factor 2 family protein [Flavobacteriaceae bacterium TP-CH-4]|uniref:Nuclear transport factor 2 family protein n=1 Tax=Pelagihabitans pacificus TaxID=2696054 RepID=A0A967AXX2_9FLAO|nr:nuclear transport factor 2 family protein [Pelagihabitans pacificus]NHF58601.1 nuclear transport factor 2 family protein [Pelagihabitans pacificus]